MIILIWNSHFQVAVDTVPFKRLVIEWPNYASIIALPRIVDLFHIDQV